MNALSTSQPRILKTLTPDQKAFFSENGYLHIQSLVPPELLDGAQKAAARWVSRVINRWKSKGFIDKDYAELPFDQRLYRAWVAANRPPYKEYITQEIADQEIFNLLMYQGLINVVSDLLEGDNILASAAYMCRPKLPTDIYPIDTPWHQDAQCTMYQGLDEVNFMTIWIPFMDVSEENSCLQVSEKAHINTGVYEDAKNGTVHYSIHPKYYSQFKNLKSVPMKRGDALCLHRLLPHRALPNKTDSMRWSMDVRYECLPDEKLPGLKRGFVCMHQNPTMIARTPEEAFDNLWGLWEK